jgi:hypothetical protein
MIVLSAATNVGCSTYHGEAAAQEQRAADDLRRGGATEAASAAQDRADQHRKSASCNGLFECSVNIVFSIFEGLLFPEKPVR